jgi:hypothetical protein
LRKPSREPPKTSYDWMVIDLRLYGELWKGWDGEDCSDRECVRLVTQVCDARSVQRLLSIGDYRHLTVNGLNEVTWDSDRPAG